MVTTNGHSYYNQSENAPLGIVIDNEQQNISDDIQTQSDKALILEVKEWPIIYNKKDKMKEDITESEAWEIIGAKLQRPGIFSKLRFLLMKLHIYV